MTNAVNVELGVWLEARLPLSTTVEITIDSGTVIGSTNGQYAIRVGDISKFLNVTLFNYGEIQGAGGPRGGGAGGAAIISNDNVFKVVNYGAIRSGGGGAQRGGTGGWGNWVTKWSAKRFDDSTDLFFYPESDSKDCQWDNVDVGVANDFPYVYSDRTGGKWYMYTAAGCNPDGHACWWQYIKRSTVANGSGGTGGQGGRGRGYNQTRQNGSYGAYGTNYGGRGGRGGHGGAWGTTSTGASKGANGTKFGNKQAAGHTNYRYKRVTSLAPALTGVTYPPGNALQAGTSGYIILSNAGTINGPLHNVIEV